MALPNVVGVEAGLVTQEPTLRSIGCKVFFQTIFTIFHFHATLLNQEDDERTILD